MSTVIPWIVGCVFLIGGIIGLYSGYLYGLLYRDHLTNRGRLSLAELKRAISNSKNEADLAAIRKCRKWCLISLVFTYTGISLGFILVYFAAHLKFR